MHGLRFNCTQHSVILYSKFASPPHTHALHSHLTCAEGSDPKLITHIYHMIAAMDGVYEFLVEYHEDWRAGLRTWLLRYVCVAGVVRCCRMYCVDAYYLSCVSCIGESESAHSPIDY